VHRIVPNPYLQYQPNRLNRPEPTGRTAAALTRKPRTAVQTTTAAGRCCFPPSTTLATVFPASTHRLSPPPRALAVPIHWCPWAVIGANPYFASSLPAHLPRLSSVPPCASHRWAIEESTSSTSCASSSSRRAVLVSSCLAKDYPEAIPPNRSSAVDSSPSPAAPGHGSTAPTMLKHHTIEELLPDSSASRLAHQTTPPPAVPPRLSVPPWRTTPRWVSWPQCKPNRIPALPTRSSTHSPLPSPQATAGIGRRHHRPCTSGQGSPGSPASLRGWQPSPGWAGQKRPKCTVIFRNFQLN
jgi:hypothetical protein